MRIARTVVVVIIESCLANRHDWPLSLLLIDADHFKSFNDTYGHPEGDQVLKTLADCLRQLFRNTDIPARMGGEEFAVILRGASTRGASRLAERLRDALQDNQAVYEGTQIPMTLSAGCAALSCCGAPTPEEMVSVADRRLYAAKQAGRNRVVASD